MTESSSEPTAPALHAIPAGASEVERAIWEALKGVIDPELGDNIVDLGMVSAVGVANEVATVEVALTISSCPLRSTIEADVRRAVNALSGVSTVTLHFGELDPEAKKELMSRARWKARAATLPAGLSARTRVIAIASGKGGVGKSSVSANLAVSLAKGGARVGVLDADISGFSLPRLLGMKGPINAHDGKMQPIKKPIGAGELSCLSMGFLSDEDKAIMWRGLLLNRAVQQFLEDAQWGEIDYLVVDLPPGTSDIQMGLSRMVPGAEMIVVTTPPLAAQAVAARAADMARRGFLRVIGVIENMSGFTCEHGDHYALFGEGGGRRLAEELGVPLLAEIPLNQAVSAGGDEGAPVALGEGPLAEIFESVAKALIESEDAVSGCSARLLRALDEAVSEA